QAAVQQFRPDIVVSDLQLGQNSGIEFLAWVHHTLPRSARVLLTGTARLEDAAEAINKCHVHRLILKPWRFEDFHNSLQELSRTVVLEHKHDRLLEDFRRLNAELEHRVRERTEEIEAKTRELQSALSQLEQKNQILEKMALTDPLTGLPNRRAIDLIARKELLRRSRSPSPVAVGLIDADHFKDINSEHLLSGGDFVLAWLGRTLQASVRAADSLGRVGGEEFMVVAPDTDRVGAERLAERLRLMIDQNHVTYNGKTIHMSVSVGFAVADTQALAGFDPLRELAAAALAEAKQRGRNRSVIKCLSSLITTQPEAIARPATPATSH
ncbi:MAG: GGDEF domain-containing protein, partial [Gemmataceae bacterium]